MRIDIITPFPNMTRGFYEESIIKRAQERKIVNITLHDLRKYTEDKHKTVDDYPYGGGAGMIMKPEPVFRAMDQLKKTFGQSFRTILLTPQGDTYSQRKARELAQEKHLVFICGHYRGVDERIVEALITDEISIGDYILTGGEIASAVIVDSIVRLLPNVLGDEQSAEGDSFNEGLLDHPHYTRPEVFRGMQVPEVLLSGHHERIKAWRHDQAVERTMKRRPDLLEKNDYR
jgi:tRNA (guanine37-N1)-methyltransferase